MLRTFIFTFWVKLLQLPALNGVHLCQSMASMAGCVPSTYFKHVSLTLTMRDLAAFSSLAGLNDLTSGRMPDMAACVCSAAGFCPVSSRLCRGWPEGTSCSPLISVFANTQALGPKDSTLCRCREWT